MVGNDLVVVHLWWWSLGQILRIEIGVHHDCVVVSVARFQLKNEEFFKIFYYLGKDVSISGLAADNMLKMGKLTFPICKSTNIKSRVHIAYPTQRVLKVFNVENVAKIGLIIIIILGAKVFNVGN